MIMIMMMLPIYDYNDDGGGGELKPEASHSTIPNCQLYTQKLYVNSGFKPFFSDCQTYNYDSLITLM